MTADPRPDLIVSRNGAFVKDADPTSIEKALDDSIAMSIGVLSPAAGNSSKFKVQSDAAFLHCHPERVAGREREGPRQIEHT